jgi:tetratricopeptide (TPR) repeat protein
MHLDLEPHPHPHPHPRSPRSILPWLLILAILSLAGFLALRGGRTESEPATLAKFLKGVALLEQYQYGDAFQVLKEVVRAQPSWDAAHFNLGLAALNLREEHLKDAEAEFREALRLNPRNLHARFSLGILLKQQHRPEEAFSAFEEVARADPGDPHALYEYGAALGEARKYPEAKAALEAAVRLQPAFSSALYRLSRVELNLNDRAAFEEELKRFKALDEGKQGIMAGVIYGEDGKYYTAIRDPYGSRGPPAAAARVGTAPPEKGDAARLTPAPEPFGGPTRARTRPDGSPAPPGLAVGDLDGDRLLDLVLCGQPGTGGARVEVWKGEGSGIGFRKTAELPVDAAAAALGDLDGDGDLDLVLADEGKLLVFENDGKGVLSPGRFKLPEPPPGFPVQLLLFDADSDWDLDILVARQLKEGDQFSTSLSLLNNNRDGSFEEKAEKIGIARFPFGARRVLFADLDGDIDADLLLLSPKEEESLVLLNDRASRYRKVPAKEMGGTAALLDRAGHPPALRASQAEAVAGSGPAQSSALIADSAGRPFFIQLAAGGPASLAPAGPAPASWIGIELNGPKSPNLGMTWSNLSGLGATVEVRAGTRVAVQQMLAAGAGAAQGPPRLYFDLGGASMADFVRILWPDGVLQSEPALAGNRVHRIDEVQRKPSSCPLVFAWDGSRFRFVADLLGAGGLGYLEAPGSYNRPDPTEVLELPDLAVSKGEGGGAELRLRILEPLEECTYLDAVELIAVDGPSDLTVHPQELFAVRAPAPGAGLLAYRAAFPPRRVTDGKGRDQTEALRAVDRVYAGGWSPDRRFPGAAEPHALVLEWDRPLARARSDPVVSAGASRPVLFLQGYVEYGYSTSNYAAAQAGVTLHAPTISVERGGRWLPLREEWGFPAGTARWMAVDLEGLLLPGDRRLKVETDMEIYWDQLFLAEATPLDLGEIGRREGAGAVPPAASAAEGLGLQVTVLEPATSTLRFHGFPRENSPDGNLPRVYQYEDSAPSAVMRPFPGRYTPYGEVGELVRKADDRLAILGEGDELALVFRADRLPPLLPGRKRTFFLSAVGYCKDMDLYTAGSDSVEPLPFRAMSGYPPPAGERPPASAAGDGSGEGSGPRERVVAPLRFGER